MSININEIEKLAKLARLEFSKEEKKNFSESISSILQYVSKLQDIKAGVANEPEAVSAAQPSGLRDDKVIGISSEDQAGLVKMAPESEDGLIKSKAVFE